MFNEKRRLIIIIAVLLGGAGVVLILTARQLSGTELPFETVAEDYGFFGGQGYVSEEPNLIVITTPEGVDSPGLGVEFGPELSSKLRDLDYEHRIAIVVLRGLIGGTSSEFTVDILQITRSGSRVILKTHFGTPGPGKGSLPATSSPYHIIALSKEGQWGQDIHFILEVDGKKAQALVKFVP